MSACRLALALLLAPFAAPSVASAHAQLLKALPPVGGTVASSPQDLRLSFSEGIEPRFSTVALATEAGAAVPIGRPTTDPADRSVLVVRRGRTLAPGTYTVTWHAVSVDTHKTQGSFAFTVGP